MSRSCGGGVLLRASSCGHQAEAALHLFEVEAVRDVVRCEEGGNQMRDGAGLPAVGAELEGVQPSLSVQGEPGEPGEAGEPGELGTSREDPRAAVSRTHLRRLLSTMMLAYM